MPRFGQGPVYTGQDDAELLDIPTWDMIQATASETFGSNPTEALQRRDDLGLARKAKDRLDLRLPWLREDPNASRYVVGESASPLLSKSEADAKIDAAGLTGHLKIPESGEHSAALDMLIDFKTRELRNKFLLDRYKGGVAGGATQLGTALATSLLDPINIGTAFIPVVGEARYAQILGRAGTSMIGRAGARSAVGAVEGLAGAALVEPIVYQSKRDIQADYTTMDSLINVGFGGVFGAALHPAAGAVGDVFARRAKVGAWAESINAAGEREVPDVPEGFMVGGGTRYIDGDDYGRGVFAVADASTMKRPESEGFGAPQVAQLGESPYADSGAPVLNPDGSVANGNKRMTSILDAYSKGEGDVYRQSIVDGAEQYGLDSEAVSGMASPVLVRVEGAREPGRWAQDRALYSQDPEVQQVYHGSRRNDIERISLDRSGTGSGEANYGFGAYFAGSREGADAIRSATSSISRIPGGKVADDALSATAGDRTAAAESLRRKRARASEADKAEIDKALDVLRREPNRGTTYTTEIPSDSKLLSWDQPFAEQPVAVREALSKMGIADQGQKGSQIYRDLAAREGGQRQASDAMMAAGIPGNRYSDGRGGSHYVVWDEGRIGSMQSLTREQHQTALKSGVAQAVNGNQVDVIAASKIDDNPESIASFLEDRRIAEEAEFGRLDQQEKQTLQEIKDLTRFDPADAAKLNEDVTRLEASLREEIRATGGDERTLDAALAESAELADELKVESQAIKGISMCLLRGG